MNVYKALGKNQQSGIINKELNLNNKLTLSLMKKIFFILALAIIALVLTTQTTYAAEPFLHWAFDEESGNTITDSSGASHSGELKSATNKQLPEWKSAEQCVSGTCLYFLGSDSRYVQSTNTTALPEQFTISAWIKGDTNNQPGPINNSQSIYAFGWQFQASMALQDTNKQPKTGIQIKKIAQNKYQNIYSAQQILDNKWHLLTVTIDRTNLKANIYIDGNDAVLDHVLENDFDIGQREIIAGAWSDTYGFFTGYLDELKIYNTILTLEEVKTEYDQFKDGLNDDGDNGDDEDDGDNGDDNNGNDIDPDANLIAGNSCNQDKPCTSDKLHCQNNKCVPNTPNIGTWCSMASHCQIQGGVSLTCDTDDHYCKGGTAGVPCLNQDINDDPEIGTPYSQLDSTQRCDFGLYCDPEQGTCKADWGHSAVPPGKLGSTANEIRDNIRLIINIALGFLGIAGVIVVIYGGVLWGTAFGEDDKVEKAKKTIVAGIIGIVIIGIAWTIVSYILKAVQDIS